MASWEIPIKKRLQLENYLWMWDFPLPCLIEGRAMCALGDLTGLTFWLPKLVIPWTHTYPICSMYGIFTYIWIIYGANVGKYSIHGACGICWEASGVPNSGPCSVENRKAFLHARAKASVWWRPCCCWFQLTFTLVGRFDSVMKKLTEWND